jgi:hypothetical protein
MNFVRNIKHFLLSAMDFVRGALLAGETFCKRVMKSERNPFGVPDQAFLDHYRDEILASVPRMTSFDISLYGKTQDVIRCDWLDDELTVVADEAACFDGLVVEFSC